MEKSNVNDDFIEKIIMKTMLSDKNFLFLVSRVFENRYFSDYIISELFDVCKNYSTEFNSIPSKDIIINHFKDDKKDDVIGVLNEIDSIDFNPAEKYDFIIKCTNDFLKRSALSYAIMDSVDIIENKQDTNKVRDLVEKAFCKDIKIDLGLDYFGTLGDRLKRVMEASENRIRTYYPSFDEFINGGFPPYTLSVFLGKIHGFKCLCFDTDITIKTNGKIFKEKIGNVFLHNINKSFINKHGEKKGKQKFNEWRKKISGPRKSSIKGISKLDLFVKKYGEEEGTKRYKTFCANVSAKGINSLNFYIEKYGEEEGRI